MRILVTAVIAAAAFVAVAPLSGAGLAEACAGLIGSNGDVQLGRTTTLAGYHNGEEHYITSFQFQGGGGEFGALIPLPGIPSNIERGGDWTLQRLVRETQQFDLRAAFGAAEADATAAIVIQEVRIDALGLTVLKGGAPDIAVSAREHGFRLSPDAPEVLDFYGQRSPIFLAAVFDGDAARERGQQIGDGTPVHLTIPTDNPWVPLRILGLGKQANDFVEADVYLLTDDEPAILPLPRDGLFLTHNERATDSLLDDLRSDKGGDWVPRSAWLTKLTLSTPTSALNYDLAVDTSSAASPSFVAAGLRRPFSVTAGDFENPFIPAAIDLPSADDDGSTSPFVVAGTIGAIALLLSGLAVAGHRSRKAQQSH